MSDIKAIQTMYKGYKFRSRLEARWAVFFDAMGIKWEYEREGYELNGVGRYLPDFWFSDLNLWGEVKPNMFTQDEKEKCKALAVQTHHNIIMLDGIPEPRLYYSPFGDAFGLFPYKEYIWSSEHVHLGYSDTPFLRWPDNVKADYLDVTRFCGLEDGCIAARSARFEHGETPN